MDADHERQQRLLMLLIRIGFRRLLAAVGRIQLRLIRLIPQIRLGKPVPIRLRLPVGLLRLGRVQLGLLRLVLLLLKSVGLTELRLLRIVEPFRFLKL